MEWNKNEYKNMMLTFFSIACISTELDHFMVFFLLLVCLKGDSFNYNFFHESAKYWKINFTLIKSILKDFVM